MRMLKWLADSRIASTSRHDGLEIELGNKMPHPVGVPLSMLQAAPDLFEALDNIHDIEADDSGIRIIPAGFLDDARAAMKKATGDA